MTVPFPHPPFSPAELVARMTPDRLRAVPAASCATLCAWYGSGVDCAAVRDAARARLGEAAYEALVAARDAEGGWH